MVAIMGMAFEGGTRIEVMELGFQKRQAGGSGHEPRFDAGRTQTGTKARADPQFSKAIGSRVAPKAKSNCSAFERVCAILAIMPEEHHV